MPLSDTWPSGGSSSQWRPWVEQFKDEVVHLSQQKESRLRNCVRVDSVTGEYHNFERLGASAMVAKTTRHTPTPIIDLAHTRRKLEMKDFLWSAMTDEEDMIRAKIDYNGEYTTNAAMAAGRQIDDLIIDAALGNAVAGDSSTVALPAGQVVAHNSEGLTLGKVIEAKKKMDKAEIAANDRALVVSADEIESMLNVTQITSSDYNTIKALRNGEIDFFLGFKWIRSEQLDDDNTNRHCIAFQKDCIGLGIGRDVTTKIDQRPDVSYAWQVFVAMSMNATRIEDEGVVRIDCLMP